LTDIRRLAEILPHIRGKISHRRLDRISPLAVPVLLEIGKEQVFGSEDQLLEDSEAMGEEN
jgi:ATP-dependent helicase Lhr and Lhr-like helicase